MWIPLFLFLFVYEIYLLTHCASFNINDSGETIMVCDLLTISHSPGYPLHTLWGRVNCLLPLGKPMFRVTFCSLITGSLSVLVLYSTLKLIFKQVLEGQPTAPESAAPTPAMDPMTGLAVPPARTFGDGWLLEIPALFGALTFAFSYQHWFQTGGAKGGIYTLNTFLAISTLFFLFKMKEKKWFIKSFILISFILGLSMAHHWPNLAVMSFAYLWFIVVSQKRVPLENFIWWALQPFFLICSVLSFLITLLFTYSTTQDLFHSLMISGLVAFSMVLGAVVTRLYNWFFLPIAGLVFAIALIKSHSPVVAMGAADVFFIVAMLIKIYGGSPFVTGVMAFLTSVSVYLYLPIRATQHPLVNWWNPQTADRLVGTVLREGYKDVGDKRGMATVIRDLKRFWLHAHHQYGEVFTFLVFLLAIWGLVWLIKNRQWGTAIGLALLGGGVWAGIIIFNNPLEGYQWTIDNFFSPVFMIVSMFAAFGVAGLCEWAWKEWPHRLVPLYLGAFVMAFALMPLLLDYSAPEKTLNGQEIYRGNDQSRYVSSYDEGMNMLKTVTDDGVIICNGDIDILPLWYLQFVEGKRTKVVSFTMQLIPYDWYRDPLFERWPFLQVPLRRDQMGREDIRPETVVQDIIEQHAKDRSFYFTNIFTAPWMREKNQALPEGFLWRMVNTKNMSYPFTSSRLNLLWDTYRLRSMDEGRGYWDEYTDVMKDSYGIGFDFTGYFGYMNQMPDLAVWSFNNALKFRQPQTTGRIYMMLGDSYMSLGNYAEAANAYQETYKRDPHGPIVPSLLTKLGDAYRLMGDFVNADSAYHQALNYNPQLKEALDGLRLLEQARQGHDLPQAKKKP